MYKSKIAVPGLVDSFQKHYEALKVPYPANKVAPLIEAQKARVEVVIKDFVAESNKQIAVGESQLNLLNSILPYDQMTLDEYAEAFPDKVYCETITYNIFVW